MSAEILRRAARKIREDWSGEAFYDALATWLDEVAVMIRTTEGHPIFDRESRRALTVARAYLGECR